IRNGVQIRYDQASICRITYIPIKVLPDISSSIQINSEISKMIIVTGQSFEISFTRKRLPGCIRVLVNWLTYLDTTKFHYIRTLVLPIIGNLVAPEKCCNLKVAVIFISKINIPEKTVPIIHIINIIEVEIWVKPIIGFIKTIRVKGCIC